jgi:hypothetical protein
MTRIEAALVWTETTTMPRLVVALLVVAGSTLVGATR